MNIKSAEESEAKGSDTRLLQMRVGVRMGGQCVFKMSSNDASRKEFCDAEKGI